MMNKKIEEISKIKNRPAVFDELEQRNIKEHFLTALINLAQPYNEGGGHRYPGYLGYLNIQDTSYLDKLLFLVKEHLPADCRLLFGPNRDNSKSKIKTVCLYALRNDDHKMRAYSCIKTVNKIYDFSGNPSIQIKFNEVGAKVWEAMTLVNRGKYIAMAFDDEVFSAPLVYDTIVGGDTQISGAFNDEEIDNVVKLLSSGYLPLQLKIIGYREITDKSDK
jgi:hypothetical protein